MNVLCVVAHPDDEVLGCGGTLAKHAEAGDDVGVTVLSHRGLDREFTRAAETLGVSFKWTIAHSYPDQKFDTEPLVKLIASVEWYRQREPDVIYTHHPGDLNLDHALTARAVLTAFRPKPGEKPRTILACEVLSSTEWTFPQVFQPNWFEALSREQFDKKIAAMNCYPSEMKEHVQYHPRKFQGILNHALYRGQQVGVAYAEAFQLLRRGPC